MVKKHSIAKRKTESTKQYGKNKSKRICTLALWWDRYFQFSQYKMLDSGENTLFNSLLAELYKENLQASIPYNHREENNELKQKQERIRKHEAKSKLERWGSPWKQMLTAACHTPLKTKPWDSSKARGLKIRQTMTATFRKDPWRGYCGAKWVDTDSLEANANGIWREACTTWVLCLPQTKLSHTLKETGQTGTGQYPNTRLKKT